MFAARFYLPQKYFAIRRAFRQLKLTLETQGDVATARKRLVTSDASVTQNERWCHADLMASLGFVYGLLLGSCGYQTDKKRFMTRRFGFGDDRAI